MDVDTGRVGDHRRFEVLVVCTANLCRSPLLEGLLHAALAGRPGRWSVRSAGTHADDGRPVHPLTARALAEHAVALPADWRSRSMRAEDVESADLVLTATRAHRGEVVRTAPTASTRTFTVRQFLRLLRTPGVDEPAAGRHAHPGDRLLDAALAARGLGPPATAAADDIADPVGHPYPVFRALAADLTAELAAGLTQGLTDGPRVLEFPALPTPLLTGPAGSIRPGSTVSRPRVPSRPGPWWSSRSS